MSCWLGQVRECWEVVWGEAVALAGRTKELEGQVLREGSHLDCFHALCLLFPLLSLIIKESICERHYPSQHCSSGPKRGDPLGPSGRCLVEGTRCRVLPMHPHQHCRKSQALTHLEWKQTEQVGTAPWETEKALDLEKNRCMS